MTTSLFSGIFSRAKAALGGNPRPASAVAMPIVIVPPVAPAPQLVSPLPKRPDVEDVRLGFRFGMQEVRIGLHHASEIPQRFSASLVGGR